MTITKDESWNKISQQTDAIVISNMKKVLYPIVGTIGAIGAGITTAYVLSRIIGDSKSNVFSNAFLTTYALARYYFGNTLPNKPSVVIGGIPLGTVGEVSHGLSDKELRYRARGGVFISDQDGGNETLRVVGLAWGENRYVFLSMLTFLYLWGSATPINLFANADFTDIELLAVEAANPGSNPWIKFEAENLNEQIYDKHLTFPVITKNRIYLSMYIESYITKETIANGQEAFEYTVFFRKYEPPPEYEFKTILVPNKRFDTGFAPVRVYRQKAGKSTKKFAASLISSWLETLLSLGLFVREMTDVYYPPDNPEIVDDDREKAYDKLEGHIPQSILEVFRDG